jgi:hypothetical protein
MIAFLEAIHVHPIYIYRKIQKEYQGMGLSWVSPQEEVIVSSEETLPMGDAIRNYHNELGGVLESFRNYSPHLCGVYLPMGPKGRIRVDIVTCVLFII